mmetsp:Transcript_33722/g.62939  ORF Transcript_33722/g.62939 Transcript_33722/m.62939 type:complete len:128 (+) Transcript_33722:101-484(+)
MWSDLHRHARHITLLWVCASVLTKAAPRATQTADVSAIGHSQLRSSGAALHVRPSEGKRWAADSQSAAPVALASAARKSPPLRRWPGPMSIGDKASVVLTAGVLAGIVISLAVCCEWAKNPPQTFML